MFENLRKFDLNHCDLPTMMWNVAAALRLLILNIDNNYNEGIPFYNYIITLATAACYFYVFLFSVIWFVFIRCPQTGDLVAAMVVASLGITSEIGTVKLLYMFVYVNKIRDIADDFLQCDAQIVPGSRFQSNLLKTLRFVKKRALFYWIVIVGNGFLYLTKPIVLTGRNFPTNQYVIYGLDPMFESPNYEIAYSLMTASVFFICYVPACVTAFLIVVGGYTEAQMLALSKEIVCIWPDAVTQAEIELKIINIDENEASNREAINKIVERRLKEVIIRHALVIRLFRKVEDVFRGAIAIGFFFLVVGLIALLLGKLENTYMQMPFAFMQVAMDCFTGQRVMDASLVFEQAVYDCQWEQFDKKNMKMVLVMLQSSQKTMQLSAGGLATLSFSCLMTITRSIYSAYTAIGSTI